MHAFMSYQTQDREIAARVAVLLEEFGCSAFMAHEHVGVSEEWRIRILQELERADLFVPILSKNYYNSIWCKQESGIAAFRGLTVIPLSIDGNIPQGFLAHIQSTKIDGAEPTKRSLLPGLAKHDVSCLIDKLIKIIGGSKSYRGAEANFDLIQPYIARVSDEQMAELLNVSITNDQICHAGLCATKYLPPLVASHGHLMKADARKELEEVLSRYNAVKK